MDWENEKLKVYNFFLGGISSNKDFREMKISAFECETKTFLKNLKATYYRKVNSPGKDTGKETVTQY
jgi:hypothetical protein